MKFAAVTAALACAGGGMATDLAGSGAAVSGPGSAASASLDHYVCTGDSGNGGCAPAKVALPNGTTFPVNNPLDHLSCTPDWRSYGGQSPAIIVVSNEFSPTGPSGPGVSLAEGRLRATCSVLPAVQFGAARAHTNPIPLATFACTSVHYPSSSSVQFAPPVPVTLNDHLTVHVLDPWLVCVPSTPQPTNATAGDLVCFAARSANAPGRFFDFFSPLLGLCVPSSDPSDAPPANSSSTKRGSCTVRRAARVLGGPV